MLVLLESFDVDVVHDTAVVDSAGDVVGVLNEAAVAGDDFLSVNLHSEDEQLDMMYLLGLF